MKKQPNKEGFSDILNIQGEIIPEIDKDLDKLLKKGLKSQQRILPGTSNEFLRGKKPFAITSVKVEFDNEEDLRKCVRLLRWSDQRLSAMGSTIMWEWAHTIREGMLIKFAVNWYDKAFFEQRRDSFNDKNHISYFNMFGKGASDMEINTEIVK